MAIVYKRKSKQHQKIINAWTYIMNVLRRDNAWVDHQTELKEPGGEAGLRTGGVEGDFYPLEEQHRLARPPGSPRI